MSDEPELQVVRKDGESSLILSTARSSLVARGSRDVLRLVKPSPSEPEAEAERIFNKWGLSYFDPDYHDPDYVFNPDDLNDCDDWARRWIRAEIEARTSLEQMGLALPPGGLSWEEPLPEIARAYNNLRRALARARASIPEGVGDNGPMGQLHG